MDEEYTKILIETLKSRIISLVLANIELEAALISAGKHPSTKEESK